MTSDTPRIQFATTSDGVRIAYCAIGEGAHLVYTPEWVSHIEMEWAGPASAFHQRLARTHTLVLYDGRGTGLSDRDVQDLSLEARLKDLEAVVDGAGCERFVLLASSQSSPVGMVYAARHPERVASLVLFGAFCGTTMHKGEGEPPLIRALLDLIRAEWGVGARTTIGFIHPDADRKEVEEGLAYLRAASTGEVAARILEENFFHMEVCDELPKIVAPALVLHRRHDNAVPLELGRRVASLLPSARFVPLDGDHHLAHQGDSEAVLQAIEEFLGVEPVPAVRAAPAPTARQAASPITILFTDMEGSTSVTERLGDARAQEILRTHNGIVRERLAAHGGSEIKHTGDGIMASFPAASAALDCAIAIQRALAEHNEHHPDTVLRVRVGLNAGEPVAEDDDLFGTAVQLARRICDRAEPGQVLASNVVRELVAGKGFLFSDRGETALRGFEDAVRLFEVRWAE